MSAPINLHPCFTPGGKKGSERSAVFLLAANVSQRMDRSQDEKRTNKKKNRAHCTLFKAIFPTRMPLQHRSQGLIRNCMLCCLPLINIGETSRARLRESVGRTAFCVRARGSYHVAHVKQRHATRM